MLYQYATSPFPNSTFRGGKNTVSHLTERDGAPLVPATTQNFRLTKVEIRIFALVQLNKSISTCLLQLFQICVVPIIHHFQHTKSFKSLRFSGYQSLAMLLWFSRNVSMLNAEGPPNFETEMDLIFQMVVITLFSGPSL